MVSLMAVRFYFFYAESRRRLNSFSGEISMSGLDWWFFVI